MRNRKKYNPRLVTLAVVVAAVFAGAGLVYLWQSRAATLNTGSEAETGQLATSTTTTCNDTQASGGKSVKFGFSECNPTDDPNAVQISLGARTQIYNPDVNGQDWYMNDHTFIKDGTGKWHLFGIQRQEPGFPPGCPFDEQWFGHATSMGLTTNLGFARQPDALQALRDGDEDFIWAPHVIRDGDTYYMFYATGTGVCGQPIDFQHFRMRLATSTDLNQWTRVGTLFTDGWMARDPYVRRIGDQWVMYYTATPDPNVDAGHIVAYRTSTDLRIWSERKTAFYDSVASGWTESPQVIQHNGYWYLFITQRGDPGYDNTDVFKSKDPFNFPNMPYTRLNSHAGEVVQDDDGKWYLSSGGWDRQGVWLAPINW